MRTLLLCVSLLALAGCALSQGVPQRAVETNGAGCGELSSSPVFVVLEEPYLGARPVKDGELSSGIFTEHIFLRRKGSLSELCDTINELTGLPIAIEPTAFDKSKSRETHINYQGTLKGLLDLLGSRFGLTWEPNVSGGVIFASTAVRTFTISATPGRITYNSNISNQSKGQTSQTSTTDLSLDVWKDIEGSIKSMLSPEGSVAANQAAGAVTVRDTAISLHRISKFVNEINERLSRQIVLLITILSWGSDSTDRGLVTPQMFFENPDAKAGNIPVRWREKDEVSVGIVDGKLKNCAVLLQALQSVDQTAWIRSWAAIVTNNYPLSIQDIKRQTYLHHGKTTQLIPGEIVTGSALTVIPHILENRRVVLQYTVNLSNLDELTEFSSGEFKIQLPKVSTWSFSQRVMLKLGQTVIVAKSRQRVAEKNTSGGLSGRDFIVIISTASGDV